MIKITESGYDNHCRKQHKEASGGNYISRYSALCGQSKVRLRQIVNGKIQHFTKINTRVMSSFLFSLSVPIVVAIVIAFQYDHGHSPTTKMNYNYIVLNDFVSGEAEQDLRTMYETIGDFASSKADFSSKRYVEIGEGYAPSIDGSCSKPGSLLHGPSNKCLFLPRMDAVQHYMKTGGYEGWKERIHKLTSRISNFIRYEFNAYNRSEFQSLFESPLFLDSVSAICPPQSPYAKPIELNLNIVTPGQGFPAHPDAVYFKNATRHQFPLWLLSVMKASGLFEADLLPQVQAIVYLGANNKR